MFRFLYLIFLLYEWYLNHWEKQWPVVNIKSKSRETQQYCVVMTHKRSECKIIPRSRSALVHSNCRGKVTNGLEKSGPGLPLSGDFSVWILLHSDCYLPFSNVTTTQHLSKLLQMNHRNWSPLNVEKIDNVTLYNFNKLSWNIFIQVWEVESLDVLWQEWHKDKSLNFY